MKITWDIGAGRVDENDRIVILSIPEGKILYGTFLVLKGEPVTLFSNGSRVSQVSEGQSIFVGGARIEVELTDREEKKPSTGTFEIVSDNLEVSSWASLSNSEPLEA